MPQRTRTSPRQPLVQTLADLREELAIGVVTHIGISPMDGEMGNQREADHFCKIDRLDDVRGLRDCDVFRAANTILPAMLLLLTRLRCTSA